MSLEKRLKVKEGIDKSEEGFIFASIYTIQLGVV